MANLVIGNGEDIRALVESLFTLRDPEREAALSDEEREALRSPAVIHYAGDKPWKRYDTNLGSLWWDYVNAQPDLKDLFDEEKARRYHGPTLGQRAVRKVKKLFGGEKL